MAVPPEDLTSPRISRPFLSQAKAHVKTAERTTTVKRSGKYATQGYRGCSVRFRVLERQSVYWACIDSDETYRKTIIMPKLANDTAAVNA